MWMWFSVGFLWRILYWKLFWIMCWKWWLGIGSWCLINRWSLVFNSGEYLFFFIYWFIFFLGKCVYWWWCERGFVIYVVGLCFLMILVFRDFCFNFLVGMKVILDYYFGEVVRKFKVEGLLYFVISKFMFMK